MFYSAWRCRKGWVHTEQLVRAIGGHRGGRESLIVEMTHWSLSDDASW